MKDEIKSESVLYRAFILPPSAFVLRFRRALRGGVSLREVLFEAARRGRVALVQSRERARLAHDAGEGAARLTSEFERKSAAELLEHFRGRATPKFFSGFDVSDGRTARLQRERFPAETSRLVECARRMAEAHRWSLLGLGERDFGAGVEWRRDPVSGELWPLAYHADVQLLRGDGSDARVLWELNRLGHFITLGRAYALTGETLFAREFFAQLESWRAQNPTGRGANWACAMEVALRAMNLLAAFQLFRGAPELTQTRLALLLAMFDDHGTHIRRHLEFSYIATSNHYLSDVVGLLWLGVCLPELRAAREWREFALGEMLREMDKQVLADGADGEASTGYHRFVLELFLYSFILCRTNGIEIDESHWRKLRSMLEYVRAYLRPDGRAPLVGDTDSGQVVPVTKRAADEHAPVLAVGAAAFDEPLFKVESGASEELLWLLGEEGVRAFDALGEKTTAPASQAFEDAGVYVMRAGDLYLLLNASGAGLGGRGSHAHNDALAVEVAACGASFIVDPGTYVYTSNLRERHMFRSTAFHSTVEVDRAEQNTTDEQTPFIIGDEARPRVLRWETGAERDFVLAEHDGYAKLPSGGVKHRRAVLFDKRERFWLIEDALVGAGEHAFRFRFHIAHGMEIVSWSANSVEICDKTGARLLIVALDARGSAVLEPTFASRDYGAKEATQTVCWAIGAHAPLVAAWALVPICADDDEDERLETLARLKRENRGQRLDVSNI